MDPRLGDAAALGEIGRAARILWVRSRREAAGVLVGLWPSAFRGGGIEFEESRLYEPGDDVRSIDWNATARTGVPWVKRFREERSCTLLLALDVSASMAFGTRGASKAGSAARAAALLAAAAARSGDPVGLLAFSGDAREAVRPGRGDGHTWRVIRAAAAAAAAPAGPTSLGVVSDWVDANTRRRALVVLLSDLRVEGSGAAGRALAGLARRHDLVAAVVEDPGEQALLGAGSLRIGDPEQPGRRGLLGTGARRRAAYARAAQERRAALFSRLRASGAEPLALVAGDDPLRPLARFFRARSQRRRRRW